MIEDLLAGLGPEESTQSTTIALRTAGEDELFGLFHGVQKLAQIYYSFEHVAFS